MTPNSQLYGIIIYLLFIPVGLSACLEPLTSLLCIQFSGRLFGSNGISVLICDPTIIMAEETRKEYESA